MNLSRPYPGVCLKIWLQNFNAQPQLEEGHSNNYWNPHDMNI